MSPYFRSNGFSSLTIDGQHKKEFSPINNGLEIRKTVDFYIGKVYNLSRFTNDGYLRLEVLYIMKQIYPADQNDLL
jgi:hypothetical protein